MSAFRPWPNGTSMMDWTDRNCDRCTRKGEIVKGSSDCRAETTLALSAAMTPDSSDQAHAREFLRWTKSYLEHDCPHFCAEAGVTHADDPRQATLFEVTR